MTKVSPLDKLESALHLALCGDVACVQDALAAIPAVRTQIDALATELATRKVVERAKGIIMERCCLDEATAYRRLQSCSCNTNRKLVDVAQDIISADSVFASLS